MKKRTVAMLFIVFFQSTTIMAQQISIKDNSTRESLANAIIKDSQNQQTLTNSKGTSDISGLNKSDSLLISLAGYYNQKVLITESASGAIELFLQQKVVLLDEVVFSANKIEEKKSDVPYNIDVITAKQIEFSNQQTAADVLQNTGNVFVQKSQMGGGSPIIRGFEANKVLIVVDGIRMNNAIYRGGHLQDVISLDAQMLDRTEVLFGPSSTIYGSDALGGVMHFYTKNAQFSSDDKMKANVNSMARYSSANQEKTGHLDFNLGFKKIAFLTNITYSNFDDLRAGHIRLTGFDTSWKRSYYVERFNDKDSVVKNADPNVQKFSAYNQLDFMQRINIKQGENCIHGLNFQMSQSSYVPRYDRLAGDYSGGVLKYAENGYGPQKRLLAAYSFSNNAKTAISDNIKVTAAYQKINQDRITRNFNNNNRKTQMEDVAVISLNADLFKKVKEKQEFRYGLEITNNYCKSTANNVNIITNSVTPADTRYADGGSKMTTAAVYMSHSFEVDKSVIVVSGLRYSYVSLESIFKDTTYFKFPFTTATQKSQAVTGNLGVIFKSDNNWKASLLGSTGFRAPNVDDISKVFDPPGGGIIVPNTQLKPEYAYNMEFNLSKVVENHYRLDASFYYTILENVLVIRDFTFNGKDSAMLNNTLLKVKATQNADRAYIYGFSGGLYVDLNRNFSFKTVINYTYGRYIDTKTETVIPLDHIPPVFGQTNLIYKASKFEGDFFVRYNGVKRTSDYGSSGEDNAQYSADKVNGFMPGWFTLNLRLGYNITNNFRVNLASENITDNHYRVFASGISAPGRNFIISLRYKL